MEQVSQKTKRDVRSTALQEAIDQRLGDNIDKAKRERILVIQEESFGPQDHLASAFYLGEISPEVYFIELTRLHFATLRKINDVLGRHDFIKLYDAPLEEIPPLIDSVAFARTHGLDTPPELPDDLLGNR